MKRFSLSILVVFLLISFFPLAAQDTQTNSGSLTEGSIESQFEYIYNSSNNFQEYKVVKRSSLDQLKSNVLDSLGANGGIVGGLNTRIQTQKDSIASLNSTLESTLEEKQIAIDAKDNFTFLGIGIHKGLYSSLMWLLVAVLAVALGFFSFQYSRSFKKIKKAERDLLEVQNEFDQHRKNTLDRERKMKRELIDAQMGKK